MIRSRAIWLAAAALLLLAWTAFPAKAAAEGQVIFYIDDVEFLDLAELAGILVRNGASFTLLKVPFGRASHLLDTDTPGCGFILSKDVPGRSDYHWLAPTLLANVVIATSDPAHPEPQAGDAVATYGAQGFLSILAEYGYQPLLYRSTAQAAKLLQTGRARFIVGIEPTLWPVEKAFGHPLATVKALHPVNVWLGCNKATPNEVAASIGRAWEEGLRSGEIQKIYEKAGILRFFPQTR
jgi:hypothetical protein